MTLFETFLSYYPEIEPPVTLTDESIDHISGANDALPEQLIQEFIKKWDTTEDDEFTEYVPCFKWKIDKIICIVYWKAGLLKYEYFLVTTNDKGELINRKSLCGTIVEGDIIKKSVARIEDENIINIVAGANFDTNEYSGEQSQSFALEIMSNGEVVFQSLGED
jgi:hypothetical protein